MEQTRAPAPPPDSSRIVPNGSKEQASEAAVATGIMRDTAAKGRQSSENNEAVEGDEENFYWRFTDVGHVGERSRDGSIHTTDEVFNSVSHLAAFFVSVLGMVLLITKSAAQHAPWKIVSFSIYGSSLCFLFAASTLHHAVTTTPKMELLFRTLDYLAIFPLIAGTFTPLCLVFLHSSVIGWSFFSVVWTLAIISMCIVAHLFEKVNVVETVSSSSISIDQPLSILSHRHFSLDLTQSTFNLYSLYALCIGVPDAEMDDNDGVCQSGVDRCYPRVVFVSIVS